MPSPLVSVVMNTFNRPHFLKEGLIALSQQEFKDFEVCLVNDGGPSVTFLVKEFSNLSIRLKELPRNVGNVRSRKLATSMAYGTWIASCDDDDLYLSSHLSDLISQSSEGRFIFSDAEILEWDDENKIYKNRLPFAFQLHTRALQLGNFIIPSSCLYERTLHEEFGEIDENLDIHWDWDWILRLWGKIDFFCTGKATLLSRYHQNNFSLDTKSVELSLEKLKNKHHLHHLLPSHFLKMAKDEKLNPLQRHTQKVWDGNYFWK